MNQTGVISGLDRSRMKSADPPVKTGMAPDCNELHITGSSSISTGEWQRSAEVYHGF
jgi:hypothetical protein